MPLLRLSVSIPPLFQKHKVIDGPDNRRTVARGHVVVGIVGGAVDHGRAVGHRIHRVGMVGIVISIAQLFAEIYDAVTYEVPISEFSTRKQLG